MARCNKLRKTAQRNGRKLVCAALVGASLAALSAVVLPSRASAEGGRSASASMHVGAEVVSSCTVGTRPFDAATNESPSVDLACGGQVTPRVETSAVVVLDTGDHVVLTTLNF